MLYHILYRNLHRQFFWDAVCGERGGGAPQTKSPSLNGLYFFTSPRLPWEKGTGEEVSAATLHLLPS